MASEVKRDVVIVGAGAAALCAARTLAGMGLHCAIVEARTYVGGRIRTEQSQHGDPVELGAEFVHGRPPEILAQAKDAGLEIVSFDRSSWMSSDGMLQRSQPMEEESDRMFEKLEAYSGPDLSFSDFAATSGLPDAVKRQATRYVEGFNAADAERVSVLGLKKQQEAEDAIDGDRVFHVRGRYGELMQSVERQIDARHCEYFMESRVDEITWKRGAVTAKAIAVQQGRRFSIHARAALITVPLSCLQRETIAFDPPLDAKQEALAHLAMGDVVRVTLEFRNAFWRERAPDMGFLFAADEQQFPVFWTAQDAEAPLITAWASGRNARRLLPLSPAEIAERAIAALGQVFGRRGDQLRDLLVSAHYHDWSRDPYALGAYSYPLVGGVEAAGELAKPLEQTLFFAGEHTENAGHHATVHGAMATGERAAREIISALRS